VTSPRTEPTQPVHVGIDVSKARLDIVRSDSPSLMSAANDLAGITELIELLLPLPIAIIAIEATGGYERMARDAMLDAGLPVAVVNPRHVRDLAKERAVGLSIDSSIVELGLDSLERMEIVAALEETYGGRFPEDVLPQIETVREVAAAVETHLGKTPRKREEVKNKEIPEEAYRFECVPEYLRLKQQMEESYSAGYRNPYFTVHERVINDTTLIAGREMQICATFDHRVLDGAHAAVMAKTMRLSGAESMSAAGKLDQHTRLLQRNKADRTAPQQRKACPHAT